MRGIMGRFGAAILALIFMQASAMAASGWRDPATPQCEIVTAARSGDNTAVIDGIVNMFEDRVAGDKIPGIIDPLKGYVSDKTFTDAQLYDTRRFEDELAQYFLVLNLDTGDKVYAVVTFGYTGRSWVFDNFVYNTDWDEISPQLSYISGKVRAERC